MEDVPPGSLQIAGHGWLREMKSAASAIEPGDILYGRLRPYLNKVVLSNFRGAASGEFIVIAPRDGIDARYIQLVMHARKFVNFAARDTTGDRPRIDFDKIAKFQIAIPPSNEQRRILARIDELFAEIAEGEAALARARQGLDMWRRALLKAAVTGELTREWRESNKPAETGADLLARIGAERVKCASNHSRARRSAEPESLDTLLLSELPEGWTWATLEEVGEIVGGVTVDKKRMPADPVTVPYLRVANVQRGHLDLAEMKTIKVGRDVAERLKLRPNDLLLNEGGDRDKIGRGWVWRGEIAGCIHQNHVFRVRLRDPDLNPLFLSHYANELGRRFFMETGKQTTNLASISLSQISRLPVPVPPPSEAEAIITRLSEAQDGEADTTKELGDAAALASALRQSILKAAFEGRLVPQDPADEPAAACSRVSVPSARPHPSNPHPGPLPGGEGEGDAFPLPPGEGQGEGAAVTAKHIRRARELRRQATPAEAALWRALRNRTLFGAKARRQMVCGPWILDFAFWTERLAVEIDGDTHATPEGIARDRSRNAWLASHGWRVLRFGNRDVLGNIEGVLAAIAAWLQHPHPNPLPEGEGIRQQSHLGALPAGEGQGATSPLPLGEGQGEGERR